MSTNSKYVLPLEFSTSNLILKCLKQEKDKHNDNDNTRLTKVCKCVSYEIIILFFSSGKFPTIFDRLENKNFTYLDDIIINNSSKYQCVNIQRNN